jgi:hypothetical protein
MIGTAGPGASSSAMCYSWPVWPGPDNLQPLLRPTGPIGPLPSAAEAAPHKGPAAGCGSRRPGGADPFRVSSCLDRASSTGVRRFDRPATADGGSVRHGLAEFPPLRSPVWAGEPPRTRRQTLGLPQRRLHTRAVRTAPPPGGPGNALARRPCQAAHPMTDSWLRL